MFSSQSEVGITSTYASGSLFSDKSCPIGDFLSCVKSSYSTLQCNQIEILKFYKNNLVRIKSEVDSCLNYVIGHELELLNKSSKIRTNTNECVNEKRRCEAVDSSSIDSSIELLSRSSKPETCESPRSNNIVIHGIDPAILDNKNYVKFVSDFFKTSLNITVNIADVNVIHGKHSNSFVAIVKLNSKREKSKIFKNCHLLKGYGKKISITDDLSAHERNNRRIQRHSQTEETEEAVKSASVKLKRQQHAESVQARLEEEEEYCQTEAEKYTQADNEENVEEEMIELSEQENEDASEKSMPQSENSPRPSHAYFWESEKVRKQLNELIALGKRYGFEEDDTRELVSIHSEYNASQLKNTSCICKLFSNPDWKVITKEFGKRLPVAFIHLYECIISNLQKIWETQHSTKFADCFCNHFLLHVDVT